MIPREEKFGKLSLFFEEETLVPVVYVYIDFLRGSECDPAGKSGLSRLAIKMLKMGTKRLSREQLNRSIESIGGDLDFSANHHYISVFGHVISENFNDFVSLLKEILTESAFRKDDFEKIKRETISEIIDSRQDDQGVAYRNFREMLFNGHPYGRRNIGRRCEVESITYEEMLSWCDAMLHRGKIALGCAGDVKKGLIENSLALCLDSLSTMEMEAPRILPPQKPSGVKIRLVNKPERVQSQIYMGHLAPATKQNHYFPAVVLNTAFGGTFTARLCNEIRKKRGMSYGAYSRILRARTNDAFYLWTFPSAEETASCLRIQMEMLRELKEKGITSEEFDFAVGHLLNHYLFAIETSPMRIALAMNELSYELPSGFFENYRDNVKKVTIQQVNETAKSFIDPENICISVLCTVDKIGKEIERELKEFSPVIEVVSYDED